MAENCARPGCGHPFATQRTGPADWESGHAQSLARECSQCPCPGYRTPEQQEAWERLNQHLDEFAALDPNDQAGETAKLALIAFLAAGLTELYP